jgi:predicted permease
LERSADVVIQLLVEKKRLKLPIELTQLRIKLQRTALLFVLPITMVGALWVTDLSSPSISALPLIGVSAIALGGILSLILARFFKLPNPQTGSLFVCGAFTNIGSVGALVCFIFLGETGFALVPIYKLFEELSYYTVGFPIARQFSSDHQHDDSFGIRIKKIATDPFILVAVSSMVVGITLNLFKIDRPAVFGTINSVFIPLGTTMLLISIGLAMKFKSVLRYTKACLMVSSVKFLMVPVITTTAAWLIGFGEIQNALPLKVVLILSSMPVAFNALIPPSIYNLDLDQANACWFFTTAALLVVLPIQLLLLGLF